MSQRAEGNGSNRAGHIEVTDKGNGYFVFAPGEQRPPRDEIPALLSRAVQDWQRSFPQWQVRVALSIVRSGNTEAVHLWCVDKTAR